MQAKQDGDNPKGSRNWPDRAAVVPRLPRQAPTPQHAL